MHYCHQTPKLYNQFCDASKLLMAELLCRYEFHDWGLYKPHKNSIITKPSFISMPILQSPREMSVSARINMDESYPQHQMIC